MSVSKAERRRATQHAAQSLLQAGAPGSGFAALASRHAGDATGLATGAFRDDSLFVQQGPNEDERREANALRVRVSGPGETSTRGGSASGLEGVVRLDSSVVDVVADDQKDMAAQMQRLHWDKRKRKYVRLTDGEAADRRGDKRLRTESGSVVRSDGKDHGELYRKWTKESKRRIGDRLGGTAEDAEGGATGVADAATRDWRKGAGRGRRKAVPLAARAGD